ncbi:MAG TPA: amidohydrolase family protein [Candidatus Acidoferrales bacterium]|nr:amidohydrolase family protein [Candidatus Acidoferrales bacterium]
MNNATTSRGTPRRLLHCLVFTAVTTFGSALLLPAQETPYDVVIAGGQIIDGTGNLPVRADVGIRGDKIARVGFLEHAPAKLTIDAHGLTIVPGFIDMHSHADDASGARSGLRSPDARRRAAASLIMQGITTVVCNPDGSEPAISIREQRNQLRTLGIGPNAILLAGYNTIRGQVMGSDYKRPATPEEIQAMQARVKEALEEGAWGLSSGLEYVPAIWSTTDELVAVVQALAPYHAFYTEHERSSGDAPMWWNPSQGPPDKPTVFDSMRELVEIGERTGVRVIATHLKSRGELYWGGSRVLIDMVDRARARGVDVWGDVYPYNTSGSDGEIVLIPRWAFGAGGESGSSSGSKDYAAALRRMMQDPRAAANVKRDIAHQLQLRGGAGRILILDYPDRRDVGEYLAEFAKQKNLSPVDAVIALQMEGYPNRLGGARVRSFSMSEIDVEALIAAPWVASSTDAGIALPEDGPNVHPRYYGSYPRKIRRYAMERKVVSVQDVIRASTSLPAQILRIEDRGLIREGYSADLAVLDLSTIRDRSTPEKPHQYSDGVDYVLINGQMVVDHTKPTLALPGRVLDPARPTF